MLSKSQAKSFFIIGTLLCGGAFGLLTLDTFRKIPGQTKEENLSPEAIRGKHLWDKNNCMGCHTLLGEGAYYAPELTKVYERRGPDFITAMLKDPYAMYPGQRKMVKYDFTPQEISDLVSFLKWIGEMDLNGFPPKPSLASIGVESSSADKNASVAQRNDRPMVFNQMCIACHSLNGQGGKVGPALDDIGSRMDRDLIVTWLKDPKSVKPSSLMPKLPLKDEDITELAAFLSQLRRTSP